LFFLVIKNSSFIEEVIKQFEESEFDMPTPIQSIAWPILSHDRDLVGIASTGSGKTLAVSFKPNYSINFFSYLYF